MLILQGKPVSPGLAEGQAAPYQGTETIPIPRRELREGEIPGELQRLDDAVTRAARKLRQLRERVLNEFGSADAQIVAVHLALLQDRHFQGAVRRRITDNRINVEWAVQDEVETSVAHLAASRDEYFQERAQDIRDIGRRLLRELVPEAAAPLGRLPDQAVIVAHELLPSDTLNLDRTHVVGIVTERGGATAHTAILARSLGIPAVTGVEDAVARIPPGTRVLVDGQRGLVTVDPGSAERTGFADRQREYAHAAGVAQAAEERACITPDRVRIGLFANIRHPEEATEVRRHHLDGVGLFRTEFMFLGAAHPPDFDRHLRAYREATAALGGLPLTVRTLDLGGDKLPPFMGTRLDGGPGSGLRGQRLALTAGRDLLTTQFQALLATAPGRAVRILLPMVVGGGDLEEALGLLRELAGPGPVPPVGAMIETPAALFSLDQILAQVDFASIGTNDLTQYMLAADRDATNIVDIWSVLHPAMLRAIAHVVEQCDRRGKPLSVCGEAAGEPALACVLVGLGVRELSVSPPRASAVRLALRQMPLAEMQDLAQQALACADPATARARVDTALHRVLGAS